MKLDAAHPYFPEKSSHILVRSFPSNPGLRRLRYAFSVKTHTTDLRYGKHRFAYIPRIDLSLTGFVAEPFLFPCIVVLS